MSAAPTTPCASSTLRTKPHSRTSRHLQTVNRFPRIARKTVHRTLAGAARAAARVRRPKPPIYKRRWPYALVAVLVAFVLTSGATEAPSPKDRPAIFGLIGRCVELENREIVDIVPCAGPHDAWVVDVIERPGQCPPLADSYLNEISHIICLNTEK